MVIVMARQTKSTFKRGPNEKKPCDPQQEFEQVQIRSVRALESCRERPRVSGQARARVSSLINAAIVALSGTVPSLIFNKFNR